MASKSRKIPAEEWEHHKQAIKSLYLDDNHTRKYVMTEMESRHGFKASTAQFEAQLRHWGFRKNTKRKEWETIFEQIGTIEPTNGGPSSITTPAGSKKPQASIKRAKRWVKPCPLPGRSHQSPVFSQSQVASGVSLNENPTPYSEVPPLWEPEDSFARLEDVLPISGSTDAVGMVGMGSASIVPPKEPGMVDFDADQPFCTVIPTDTMSPPSRSDYEPWNLGFANQYVSPGPLTFTFSSHFAKFEKNLRDRGCILVAHDSVGPREIASSLSGSSTLKLISDIVCTKQLFVGRRQPDVHTILQRLGTFLPGQNSSLITGDQMFETNFTRFLLYSMLNGFAGLNDLPMEKILQFLGRFRIVNRSLLSILKECSTHASTTFKTNVFRAAIEAKDERVLKQLLEHQLVDVNEIVCFAKQKRYTPVERAASLEALKIIRLLVHHGADPNKSYLRDGGVLTQLLVTKYVGNHYQRGAVTPPPDLIEAVDLLVNQSAKVTVRHLKAAGRYFVSYEIAYLLSLHFPPSNHQNFFSNGSIIYVANYSDEDYAFKVIYNMIELCRRAECGNCLANSTADVEFAAIRAAELGHHKVIELLIDHIQSPTRVFAAAIRSNSKELIDFILLHNPNFDPPAQPLRRIHLDRHSFLDEDYTTPLAEAVRAGNKHLTQRLEAAGVFNSALRNPNPNIPEDRFGPLVEAAVSAGNMHYVEKLLLHAGNSPHPYRVLAIALVLALENGHKEVAWALLEHGVEVREIRGHVSIGHSSPLSLALRRQNAELVHAILHGNISSISDVEFMDAVKWGNMSIIFDIILTLPCIRISDKGLALFCSLCMEQEKIDSFRHLLESVSFVGVGSLTGCLITAVRFGNSEMVGYLLDAGAYPFDTHVMEAAIHDRPEMLQLLFSKSRKRQMVPKCIAARILKSIMEEKAGNIAVLEALLETRAVSLMVPESINIMKYWQDAIDSGKECIDHLAFEHEYLTPLGLALVGSSNHRGTSLWMVKRLLEAGSDANGVARVENYTGCPIVGYTGLMLAIETGREDVIQLLMDYKADVNKKPHLSIKKTPLQYAAELGNLEIVCLLLRHGADVNAEPAIRGGGTALQFAAISGNCNIVTVLLEYGARLDILPSKVEGRWPFEAAAEHGRLDMIQFLWDQSIVESFLPGELNGFQRRHCLRAMYFARENGHTGCRDLVSELAGIPVDRLDIENYGAPWLAY